MHTKAYYRDKGKAIALAGINWFGSGKSWQKKEQARGYITAKTYLRYAAELYSVELRELQNALIITGAMPNEISSFPINTQQAIEYINRYLR